MAPIVEKLEALGNLHDARPEEITWSEQSRRLTVQLNDLNANFQGRPEYSGAIRARIVFPSVRRIKVSLEIDDARPRIESLVVTHTEGGVYRANMTLTSGSSVVLEGDAPLIEMNGDGIQS